MRRRIWPGILAAMVISVAASACGSPSGTPENRAALEEISAETPEQLREETAESGEEEEAAESPEGEETADAGAEDIAERTVEFREAGITVIVPPGMSDLTGLVGFSGGEEISAGSGVYVTQLAYFGLSAEELQAQRAKNPSFDAFTMAVPAVTFVCVKDGSDAGFLRQYGIDTASFEEIAREGSFTHYLVRGLESDAEYLRPAFREEFTELIAGTDGIVRDSSFYEPVDPYAELQGSILSFETTDIDGNPVNSGELFAENRVTMINLWTSWCIYCVKEMAFLEDLDARLAEEDCAVISILCDAGEAGAVDTARQLMADNGADYLVLMPTEEILSKLPLTGYPTTYFADSRGRIVGSPIVGAQTDRYAPAVTAILEELETDEDASARDSEEPGAKEDAGAAGEGNAASEAAEKAAVDGSYVVLCVNEDGEPVSGASVQFCTDSICTLAETDGRGLAVFPAEPGEYTVHLVKPPAGYAADGTEYEFPGESTVLTIVLVPEQ